MSQSLCTVNVNSRHWPQEWRLYNNSISNNNSNNNNNNNRNNNNK